MRIGELQRRQDVRIKVNILKNEGHYKNEE